MRNLFFIFFGSLLALGCVEPEPEAALQTPAMDAEAELALIEETRTAFEAAVREGRYQDLADLVTSDVITVSPGGPEWERMHRLGAERNTPFPYDSIDMNPTETVIVSDSIAWDFGTSSVYFTDEGGEVRELQDTFLVILKKGSDGVWRVHREVASSSVE